MTHTEIKHQMERNDIESVAELHRLLEDHQPVKINYVSLTMAIAETRPISKLIQSVLHSFFKSRDEWRRNKLDELESEIENDI